MSIKDKPVIPKWMNVINANAYIGANEMKNGMAYIRNFYGVPAKRGAIVWYKGHCGVITGSKDAYLRVRMEDFDIVKTFHPRDLVFDGMAEPASEQQAKPFCDECGCPTNDGKPGCYCNS